MNYLLATNSRSSNKLQQNGDTTSNIKESDYVFPIERALMQPTIPSNFPAKEASLLQMFNAELFTTEYLIEYLFKMYEQPGVHEYLVSKLYSVLHSDLDFYITFIV